jgi:hypothetical protein
MSSTDRSNTERIRQLKARLLAATITKGTYKTNDGETWLDIKIGREGRVINPAGGGPAVSVEGCCNCQPVCDMSGDIFYFIVTLTAISEFQDYLNSLIFGSVIIPPPPPGYPNDYFLCIFSPNGCNITNTTAIMYDNSNNILDTTQYYLGTYPSNPESMFIPSDTLSFSILYPTEYLYKDPVYYTIPDLSGIDITFSNACSSITEPVSLGCFLPGTPVALAGGVTKPIEDVAVGDLVIGAFGELNPVTALHRPLLGAGKVCRINDEHTTTTHHPHIGADRGFYCPNPAALNNFAYGQKHTVILGDGSTEKRVMTGVRRDRILALTEGTVLQTLTGPKTVTKVEPVAMSPFTQVYHLVVGGSHTYMVDGYAVVGWAREDDFDYDSWSPKTN